MKDYVKLECHSIFNYEWRITLNYNVILFLTLTIWMKDYVKLECHSIFNSLALLILGRGIRIYSIYVYLYLELSVLFFFAFFFFLLYPSSVLVLFMFPWRRRFIVETVGCVLSFGSSSSIGEYVFLVIFHCLN